MRFSPLTQQETKRNGKLFLVTLVLGFLLRNNEYYKTTLHEINHILAALYSGNIPLGFIVNRDGSGVAYVLFITGMMPIIGPSVFNFVSAAGPGLAFAAPFLVYIIGLKLHIPGIAGLWIAGAPKVFEDWGRGPDFDLIVDNQPWMYLMFFLAIVSMYLALWATYYVIQISVEHQETLAQEKRKRALFLQNLKKPAEPRKSVVTKKPTNNYGSPQIPSYQALEERKRMLTMSTQARSCQRDQTSQSKPTSKKIPGNNSSLLFQRVPVQHQEYEIQQVVGFSST